MKAIIADIHGNYPALKKVLDELDRQGVREIISLGDVAGYYPFINECIDALRERDVVNLMGNHDFYLVSGVECPRSKSVYELATLQQKAIRKDNIAWLAASKLCLVDEDVSMVHGGWNNPLDEYIRQVTDGYFAHYPQRFFFSGHTHVQRVFYLENGKVYCNPGSVGQPRDGDPKAAYALFDGNSIELRRMGYDVDIVVSALREQGFFEYYSDNLYQGCRIGGRVDRTDYLAGD